MYSEIQQGCVIICFVNHQKHLGTLDEMCIYFMG